MNKYIVATGILTVILGMTLLGSMPTEQAAEDNQEVKNAFKQFISDQGRYYLSQSDYDYRFKVFSRNHAIIQSHNADKTQTFTVGINQFTDMTFAEMKATFSPGFDKTEAEKSVAKCPLQQPTDSGESKLDWAEKGKVSPVKDQKHCGSCWAFSATGALESAVSISTDQYPPNISDQELVDCSRPYGNKGCQGGYMHFAYNYVLEHGINLSKDYPYKARNQKCREDLSGKGPVKISGCVRQVPTVDGLIELLHKGPVAVGIFADILMYMYNGGVFNIPEKWCDYEVDHGVLAVGFDRTAELPYFTVKNSWGEKWGERGYFKIAMGTGTGLCRMAGSGYNYLPVV